MGVNLNSTSLFGNLTAPAVAATEELPKAQTWANIGYEVGEADSEDYRFVALPMGIPLDTMKPIEIKTRDPKFGAFQAAQNDLLSQVVAEAAKLEPGQSIVIGERGGLQIQVRKVNEPVVAPAADENNPYAMKLFA